MLFPDGRWSRITLSEFAEAANCSEEEIVPDLAGLIVAGIILIRGEGAAREYSVNVPRLAAIEASPN
ncbi:MAG: hypothetical protein ABIR70_09330 [Bryobacteraceae bacterium]